MIDNEIIKSLELCAGSDWKCYSDCLFSTGASINSCNKQCLARNVLDLLSRQKARIKELENELQQSEQEADITETVLEERNKDIYDLISKERSNAILEFAEALKQEADNYVAGDDFVTVDKIDNLVKEMTEVEE